MKQEYAESVAARIIEQLEQGTAPWLKPWKPGELRMPYNPKTGSQYRGMNSLWLHMQGYADPRWMTYKQAASEEAQVKKGEKGTQIIYWKFTDEIKAVDEQGQPIIDPETGEQKKIVVKLDRPRSFSAVVFNAEQIDGLPPLEARPIQPEPERHSRAEAILAASGANIQNIEGDRAFYRPSTDSITLPLLSQFSSSDAYYATALHELGHWTGHESRLDRDLNHPFGSEGYAREELRAEIASFMLGERLDIGHDPGQHVAYIGSWVKTLKEDPREIFRAAADAEHIAGFVMGFEQEQFKDMDKPIIVAKPLNEPVNNPNISQARTYLTVPFAEKDEAKEAAKAAGFQLKWDKEAKSWYAPEGANLEAVSKWRTDRKIQEDETPKEGNLSQGLPNQPVNKPKEIPENVKKFLKELADAQDYEHAGYFILYQSENSKVAQLEQDEDIEKVGDQILEAIETGKGLELKENQFILETIEKLKTEYSYEYGLYQTTENEENELEQPQNNDPQFDGPGYDPQFDGPGYDPQFDGPGYDPQFDGPGYDPQFDGPGYDPQLDNQQINASSDERFVMYHEPQPEAISPSRTYLAVPYAEKDEAKAVAKAAGFQLKWDKEAKSWYAPEGANLEAVSKWRTDNGNVLKNTEEKESVESQFARALKEAKLVVDSPVMDGKLHRVPTTTDKKGGLSGAYAGHLDGITAGGYIQNYHTGEVVHWKPEGAIKELTPEQRAEQTQQAQQQYEARQAERLAKHEATAEAAQILWKEAPLATPENQYCKAKGMLNPAASGLKVVPNTVSPEAHAKGIRIAKTAQEAKALRLQDPKNRVFKAGDLLVPCYDMEGKLWSLQSVNPYFKSLMKGGRKAGLLSVVGAENIQAAFDKSKSDPSFPLVLAGEGIATADTVSRLMRDRPVFLAIDSGNIDSVARQLREKNPTGLLLIAADNDHMKPRELDENGQPQKNVGLIKAKEAAENHGAGLMVPKFDHDEKGSDWNDLAANRGDKIAQRMLADEFIVAKRDAAIAADRMISLARSREAEARNDPTTSADDAYISSERDHAADMIAGASRHVSNINMAIADGKISTKGVNNRASVNASIQSKSTSMNERIKAERQSVTYEDAQKKGEEALKPKKTRSRGYDAGM